MKKDKKINPKTHKKLPKKELTKNELKKTHGGLINPEAEYYDNSDGGYGRSKSVSINVDTSNSGSGLGVVRPIVRHDIKKNQY